MDEPYRQGPSLLESLWRYRFVVVLVPLLTGLLGYVIASQQTPSYDAAARLFLSDPGRTPGLNDGYINQVNPAEFIPQEAARASSRAVFIAAREQLDDPPPLEDLIEDVTLTQTPAELSLTITARSSDPQQAADIANAMATAYMTLNALDEREAADRAVFELERQSTALADQLGALEDQLGDDPQNLAVQSQIQNLSLRLIDLDRLISTVRIEAELRGDGVEAFEDAEVPDSPARPRTRLLVAASAFIGALAVAIWAFWFAGRSQRVLSRGDPEKVLGVPLLGEIPLYRMAGEDPLTGLLRVDPAAAEAYEFVLSSIEFALGDVGGKALLITSTMPGDGKTTTTLQLAIAASRDRRRVVLVDADIRARGLTRVLGAEDRTGLSDLAAQDLQPSDVMRRYRFSEQSQIPVVTAGTRRGDPAALLRTGAFRRAMAGISDVAELVLIDTSPLLAVADATIVAASADSMVLVVSHGTPMGELQKVRERLKFVSTPLLGYIYNRSDASTAQYGYGYGADEDERSSRRLVPGRVRRTRASSNGGTARPAPAPDVPRRAEASGSTAPTRPDGTDRNG